jgi:hypothetical protein
VEGDAHTLTTAELAARLAVERAGDPYLSFRDFEEALRLVPLEGDGPITIGRGITADIVLDWDSEVSRVHAELVRVAGSWAVVDDGLSRNGTFLNGRRVNARKRLASGDAIRVGGATLRYLAPADRESTTLTAVDTQEILLTEAERRVLIALCGPCLRDDAVATPASNREIGEELHMSVAGVKARLRALFARFAVEDELPQNRKRGELVRRAISTGVVSRRDLTDQISG